MIKRLGVKNHFPQISEALTDPNGLLAWGGDLSTQRLKCAYEKGIFPWYGPGDPILWWSPDPRLVLFPDSLKVSRSLKKVIRQQKMHVTLNESFESVMYACADVSRHGQEGTWIDSAMAAAYLALNQQDVAHSIEVWKDNKLVGGLYGVALGSIFFGESMFSEESNASKVALVYLSSLLKKYQFLLIDCQVETPHLVSLGAALIERAQFQTYLQAGNASAQAYPPSPLAGLRGGLSFDVDGEIHIKKEGFVSL